MQCTTPSCCFFALGLLPPFLLSALLCGLCVVVCFRALEAKKFKPLLLRHVNWPFLSLSRCRPPPLAEHDTQQPNFPLRRLRISPSPLLRALQYSLCVHDVPGGCPCPRGPWPSGLERENKETHAYSIFLPSLQSDRQGKTRPPPSLQSHLGPLLAWASLLSVFVLLTHPPTLVPPAPPREHCAPTHSTSAGIEGARTHTRAGIGHPSSPRVRWRRPTHALVSLSSHPPTHPTHAPTHPPSPPPLFLPPRLHVCVRESQTHQPQPRNHVLHAKAPFPWQEAGLRVYHHHVLFLWCRGCPHEQGAG